MYIFLYYPRRSYLFDDFSFILRPLLLLLLRNDKKNEKANGMKDCPIPQDILLLLITEANLHVSRGISEKETNIVPPSSP